MKRIHILAAIACCFVLSYCSTQSSYEKGLPYINETVLAQHIQALAHDSMMGRAPATPGEQMAVDYIIKQFEAAGLEPGMPDGGWVQKFPILAQQTDRNTSLRVTRGGQPRHDFQFGTDLIVSPAQDQEFVSIQDAELLWVGYGIVAPEENWNDYRGVDVTGKILLMKNSDPSAYPNKFAGEGRTYYGRWTYTYEIAQEMGALGVIIVHTTPSAGYGWSVVANSFGRERFTIMPEGEDRAPTKIQGWLSESAARDLFNSAGYDMDELMAAAEFMDFTPVPLHGLRASIDVRATNRQLYAQNVVGKLRGNDPIYRDEYVVFSAHHDHLGVGDPVNGDSIYNGALDNASGVASIIAMANGYSAIRESLNRSMLFVAVGAEESGLLGAKYFAANPTVHPGFMTANINMDGAGIFGPTRDIVSIGLGRTSIDEIMIEEAAKVNRVVAPDPNPDLGLYYRSDHFAFAQIGVPSTFTTAGTDYIGQPADFYETVVQPEMNRFYHTVFDEFSEDWNMTGMVQDAQLMFKVGYRIANHPVMMTWKPGGEFQTARDRALQERSEMSKD